MQASNEIECGVTVTHLPEFPEFKQEDIEKTEVIEHAAALTDRSAARRTALQVLYEVDTTDHLFGDVITHRLAETPLSKRAERHLRREIKGVIANWEKLNAVIRYYATEWPLEQIAVVDRNILRLALYELGSRPRTPTEVVIKEAIELTDLYGSEGSSRLVHGVLAVFDNADDETLDHILGVVSEDDGNE